MRLGPTPHGWPPAPWRRSVARCYHPAMLDHEEKFLFKEEILHLANAVARARHRSTTSRTC